MTRLLLAVALLAGCTSDAPAARSSPSAATTTATTPATATVTTPPATPRDAVVAAVATLRREATVYADWELRVPGANDAAWHANTTLDLRSGTTHGTAVRLRPLTSTAFYVRGGTLWLPVPEERRSSVGGRLWVSTSIAATPYVRPAIVDPVRVLGTVATSVEVAVLEGTVPSSWGTLSRYAVTFAEPLAAGKRIDVYVDSAGRLHALKTKVGRYDALIRFRAESADRAQTPPEPGITREVATVRDALAAAGLS